MGKINKYANRYNKDGKLLREAPLIGLNITFTTPYYKVMYPYPNR